MTTYFARKPTLADCFQVGMQAVAIRRWIMRDGDHKIEAEKKGTREIEKARMEIDEQKSLVHFLTALSPNYPLLSADFICPSSLGF